MDGIAELLGEKTEVQSVREHLQKKQKQTAERKKTSKKHEVIGLLILRMVLMALRF